MDPTAKELKELAEATVPMKAIRDWVGLSDALWNGIVEVMDEFVHVREVCHVLTTTWNEEMESVMVQALDGDGQPTDVPPRKPKAREWGQVGSFRRICFLVMGGEPK